MKSFPIIFALLVFAFACNRPSIEQPELEVTFSKQIKDTLDKFKERAIERGVILKSEKKWQQCQLILNGEIVKAKLKYKGDWTDHLSGTPSYRIKLENNKTFHGLSTFAIQHPKTRHYLDEWLLHQLMEKEDIITTRYLFSSIGVNGSASIYAVEEHFDHLFSEIHKKPWGPVLKLDEDPMWIQRATNNKTEPKYVPYMFSMDIVPFQKQFLNPKDSMHQAFVKAQNLLYRYKFNQLPVSKVFDVDKLIKFLALIDLTGGYHSLVYHNQRWYYNPKKQLLEPVLYDAFNDKGMFNLTKKPFLGYDPIVNNQNPYWEELIRNIFMDSTVVSLYLNELKRVSNPNYLDTIISKIEPELKRNEQLIQEIEPDYYFDLNRIINRAQDIAKTVNAASPKFPLNYKYLYKKKFSKFKVDSNPPVKDLSLKAYFFPTDTGYNIQVSNFYHDTLQLNALSFQDTILYVDSVKLAPFEDFSFPSTFSCQLDNIPLEVLFWASDKSISYTQEFIKHPIPKP